MLVNKISPIARKVAGKLPSYESVNNRVASQEFLTIWSGGAAVDKGLDPVGQLTFAMILIPVALTLWNIVKLPSFSIKWRD